MTRTRENRGQARGHQNSDQFEVVHLESSDGLRVALTNYGASIFSIVVPTASCDINTVLSYSRPSDYRNDHFFMGSTLGRFAGRINRGKFSLGGSSVKLESGDHEYGHSLHGGPRGLHSRFWNIEESSSERVRFVYESPAGEQGFPGTLLATVIYSVVDKFGLNIDFSATCDEETVVNLANHAYFNLNGVDGETIDDHELMVNADQYTALSENLIPTGEILNVADTPFDFRRSQTVKTQLQRLANSNDSCGFDLNFVLRKDPGEFGLAATLRSADSGLGLQVFTTQPGLQLYTGDQLGAPFRPRAGLCLEAQHFPDSPNQPNFPSTILQPGEQFRQRTLYAFQHSE